MSFPVPSDEAGRLAALDQYNVVGTLPEPAFDDLAELAGQVCRCPIGLINLVGDDWEWFKGKYGLPASMNGEPRGGFCSSTICRADLLVVPDLAEDDRFADHAGVTEEPRFRFYAGMPLINPEGHALGTLCVLDFEPRELTFEVTESLRRLARQAVAQLELRRRLIELDETRRALEAEKERADELLGNVLPAGVARELKAGRRVEPKYYDSVTILFTDFKDFTRVAETMEPRQLVDELNHYFSTFDEITGRHRLEKLKTIGDAYMCAGGVPEANRTHPIDACLAALEIEAFVARSNDRRGKMRLAPWEMRIGIHTGPVMAGIVGLKRFTFDILGDAVNIAAFVEATG